MYIQFYWFFMLSIRASCVPAEKRSGVNLVFVDAERVNAHQCVCVGCFNLRIDYSGNYSRRRLATSRLNGVEQFQADTRGAIRVRGVFSFFAPLDGFGN